MQYPGGRYRPLKHTPKRRLVNQDHQFGYCFLFQLELDLTAIADEHGLTVKGDILHFGNLIYSIAAWAKIHSEV